MGPLTLRLLSLASGRLEGAESRIVTFRQVREMFTSVAAGGLPPAEGSSVRINFAKYCELMRLIAAEMDAGAAPYIFPLAAEVTSYPEYAGHSLLGNIISMYRDGYALLCSLSMTELFALIEFMQYGRLQPGQSFCTEGVLASRAAIVLSGSLKHAEPPGKPPQTEYLFRGHWCAEDVLLLGRKMYTTSIVAEQQVEMAIITSEAFTAFCERIDGMYAKHKTLSNSEAVKERLFMHESLNDVVAKDFADGVMSKSPDASRHSSPRQWRQASPTSTKHSPSDASRRSSPRQWRQATPTSTKHSPSDFQHYMRRSPVENDEEFYHEHIELFKQARRSNGEEAPAMDRPKTATIRSDYAEQLHELGCYYFGLRKIAAARRLLCEACRIRAELFGVTDGRSLSSVRVLEQVDKWAYRQVDDSIRLKVLDRSVKHLVMGTNMLPQTQLQVEADMREFLRSRGASRDMSRSGARADDAEVSRCGLGFLSVATEDEPPVPRQLVQKYSNLHTTRKEWLADLQDNVQLIVHERIEREALRNASKLCGDRAIRYRWPYLCAPRVSVTTSLPFSVGFSLPLHQYPLPPHWS